MADRKLAIPSKFLLRQSEAWALIRPIKKPVSGSSSPYETIVTIKNKSGILRSEKWIAFMNLIIKEKRPGIAILSPRSRSQGG